MADRSSGASQQNRVNDPSVHMELNRAVVASICHQDPNKSPSSFGLTCIYKVPSKFHEINKYAYTPEIVAIGPYHRGKGSLQAMEEHKYQYVGGPHSRMTATIWENCVKAIRLLEGKARKCYSEPIELGSNEFVEMMLVDSWFIIEFFRKVIEDVPIRYGETSISKNKWMRGILMRDMLLLDNQLPMFVVETVFNLTRVPNQERDSFTTLAFQLIYSMGVLNDRMGVFVARMGRHEIIGRLINYKSKHLLDLLCNTYQPPLRVASKLDSFKHLPCVSELRQAGVKFKSHTTGNFLGIRFNDGLLEIPPIDIRDQTESFFRNLILWEQCCFESNKITSYAFFMDRLINSAEDVRILRKCGIITNYLGDDEVVSSLFNKLCNNVANFDFWYAGVCDRVIIFSETPRHIWQASYYKIRWHLWKEKLKHEYFHSPWALLSFLAAVLIIIFTFTGTLFSMLSYFVHKS